MYRITVTQDPINPGAVTYQGIDLLKANTYFADAEMCMSTSCVIMHRWDTTGNKKRGEWKTVCMFKRYEGRRDETSKIQEQ